MSSLGDRLTRFGRNTSSALQTISKLVAVVWIVEIVDWAIFSGGLDQYGIIPRQQGGLPGVFLAPLLHGDFNHLMANTVPLLVLGTLVLLVYGGRFLGVTAVIALISGLGTWLIGPANSVHIGASGLIFGYFGFLVVVAYYERSLSSFALAVVVMALYGSIIVGVLPEDGISWQGHLFGLIGGVVAARLFARRPRSR